MASADVGDDWYGDDPTINRLQDRAAELTGKQAAVFLPTGTLCNQIALHLFARAGHFVMCEAGAHVCGPEVRSAAVLSGLTFRRIHAPARGLLTVGQVAEALSADPADVRIPDLVALENTNQAGGGSVLPLADVKAIAAVCADHGLPVYLDGARIFNACTVTGATIADFAGAANAMMFCLSKGLGAPIGSVLVGDSDFILEARELKRLFGAAWRQAGIVAAAGLVALAEGPGRLHEDHANAKRLAEGVADLVPGSVDPASVETNIVFADVAGTGRNSSEWKEALATAGVLVTQSGSRIRMVTHVGITAADVVAAVSAWRRLAATASA